MAITIDTVAAVRVVPDLSAFTQAEVYNIIDVMIGALSAGTLPHEDHGLLADALLEHFWIVPKT